MRIPSSLSVPLALVALSFFPGLFVATFLSSARIPDRWEHIPEGHSRASVFEFIGESLGQIHTTTNRDGIINDEWRIDRPIGRRLLIVSYDDTDPFSHAHLHYDTLFFKDYTRARNCRSYDTPYEARANRCHPGQQFGAANPGSFLSFQR